MSLPTREEAKAAVKHAVEVMLGYPADCCIHKAFTWYSGRDMDLFDLLTMNGQDIEALSVRDEYNDSFLRPQAHCDLVWMMLSFFRHRKGTSDKDSLDWAFRSRASFDEFLITKGISMDRPSDDLFAEDCPSLGGTTISTDVFCAEGGPYPWGCQDTSRSLLGHF